MIVLQTERLVLREATPDDAPFILELLNDPGWLRYIGDKGVRNLDDACRYILTGPMAMYARHGFGLYVTTLKDGLSAIGLCGIIRRDGLDDPDVGFAFLPAFRGRGYAYEAVAATLAYGRGTLGLVRIVAITSPENERSARLLGKVGFKFDRMMRLTPDSDQIRLFAPEV